MAGQSDEPRRETVGDEWSGMVALRDGQSVKMLAGHDDDDLK